MLIAVVVTAISLPYTVIKAATLLTFLFLLYGSKREVVICLAMQEMGDLQMQ